MDKKSDSGMRAFITWQAEYDCRVTVINQQHQDVLSFINHWYNELREIDLNQIDILAYMQGKFRYLDFYSKYHLAFEEMMLRLMVDDHGFPREEYDRHLEIHRAFMKNFMAVLDDQFSIDREIKKNSGMEFIVIDSLRDVAKWWFSHIKTPSSDLVTPPDHVYRIFFQGLSPEAQVSLLNRVTLHFADIARTALLASF